MLFNSFDFIFLFLPVTVLGYFLLARLSKSDSPQLIFLSAASLFFYSYWNIKFLPIIIASIAFNFLISHVIINSSNDSRRHHLAFAAAIIVNLAALFLFKYINFALEVAKGLLGFHSLKALDVPLPLGISFFTFTQIAYLVDIYRGYKCERNIVKYVLFVSYFPHLIAGPILHHSEMMWQFGCEEKRRFSTERLAVGLAVFVMGLFKKTVFADSFATLATPVFSAAAGGTPLLSDAWVGALAYSLQIYFDFSGYSDMAIGLSTMLGITLPFNFNSPYKARSIIDFWRRWHITLSRFLRDYLYIPLGGNRRGEIRRYLNLFVTMVLGGIWHGAGWTYIVWGALHGVFLCCNHLWLTVCHRSALLTRLASTRLYGLAMLLLTQFSVVVAWIFFRAENVHVARNVLRGMFSLAPSSVPAVMSNASLMLLAVGLGYLWCILLPNLNDLFEDSDIGLITYKSPKAWSLLPIVWNPSVFWGAGLAVVTLASFLAIILSGTGTPFLYFQF